VSPRPFTAYSGSYGADQPVIGDFQPRALPHAAVAVLLVLAVYLVYRLARA